VPLLRWDNKEEFRHLETYPHHHHDDQGDVNSSPLTGDPVKDIEVVLREVSAFLSGKTKGQG
jgi:phage terminase large subunit-like protein